MKKNKVVKRNKGFSFYRTREQILEYMQVPAKRKMLWLEEMWQFNKQAALHNPTLAKIQERFC